MNIGTMLNAYPDSLGTTLKDATELLNSKELESAFESFYILSSLFHTDLDRGFSAISYDLDQRLDRREDLDLLKSGESM